jgi:putative FmdB family regulatory protein
MPIYDYECQECGHSFEDLARVSAPPVTDCPACECRGTVRRVIMRTHDGEVAMHSREYFRRVLEPEAKRIARRIREGDEDALADIVGEDKMK